ncbi:unnamed protein product, partial [Medioppia subpectinata]
PLFISQFKAITNTFHLKLPQTHCERPHRPLTHPSDAVTSEMSSECCAADESVPFVAICPKQRIGSRLPRMSSSSSSAAAVGSDSRRSGGDSSAIPRPHKHIHNNNNTSLNHNINNNNELFHKRHIVCNEDHNHSNTVPNNHNKSMNRRMDSFDGNNCETNVGTNCIKTTTSLCKSQSLNEIQYENSEYLSKVNVLSNGCDSQKAFSFEQLDEEFANSRTRSSNLTKDKLNSDLNLMEMSVDESSTASLGLLPNILSSLSPFDAFNQNIPFVSIESDFMLQNDMKVNNSDTISGATEDDDDSENGIPVIQEEESDTTITNACEESHTSLETIHQTNGSNN